MADIWTAWRSRLARLEGLAFDTVLMLLAGWVAEDAVEGWLLQHTGALYHGLVVLHLLTCPAILVATVCGYGKTDQELGRPGTGLIGWAVALVFCGSFVVPGVLGLALGAPGWEMMVTIFGPVLVVFPSWMGILVIGERRGFIAPARMGQRKPFWRVQTLALLTWAYLLWLETMLLVTASRTGPLSEVGIPLGVLIDYLPIRVLLYYVRDSSPWERYTIAAGVLHLLYRITTA